MVNVGQRTSLYRTIERLEESGLVAVLATGRDQQYPERTVYEITDAGRAVTREWLAEMLAVPKSEFPEFPAALYRGGRGIGEQDDAGLPNST